MKTPPLVIVNTVSKRYERGGSGVAAVLDVSFSVAAGELVALVGPSGCGKSTTLNLLAGVDRPDSGSIESCGVRLETAPEAVLTDYRRKKIGIVFQQFHLMQHLTVQENVMLPLSLDSRRDADRVRELLNKVGLAERSLHFPTELSGGEQQRVAIARALVHKPALVLADEPTGNLDSRNGDAVMDLLHQLRSDEGASLLLVTHDPRVAARADRILYMKDGRISDMEI